MPVVPPNIALSGWDVERERLETTLQDDLSTLSLSSIDAGSHRTGGSPGASFLSSSTIERPRAFGEGETAMHHFPWPGPNNHHLDKSSGPSGTPRAAHWRRAEDNMQARKISEGAFSLSSMPSMAESPKSTDGHHVSAMTLADGVFRRQGMDGFDDADQSEFDPERSLGRLVGELGRVMSSGIAPRPASPFAHVISPPRSPSPLPSHPSRDNVQNLSFTLTRADALPSPPDSRGSNGSGKGDATIIAGTTAGFTSMARQLNEDRCAPTGQSHTRGSTAPSQRRALSDSTTFNIAAHAGGEAQSRRSGHVKANTLPVPAHAGGKRGTTKGSSARRADITSDITGMTGLMATPAKGGAFDDIGKENLGTNAAGDIPQTLATLHARLRGLETERSIARRRVRELETELDKARGEVETERRQGGTRLDEVAGEKSILEELVHSLRANLARLTAELESNKRLVDDLRAAQATAARVHPPTPPRPSTANELIALRREIERLSLEIRRLGGIVEQGLETRRRTREERAVRIDETLQNDQNGREVEMPTLIELDEDAGTRAAAQRPSSRTRGAQDPISTQTRTGTKATSSKAPSGTTPTDRRASGSGDGSSSASGSESRRKSKSRQPRVEGPSSPFPSIRAEDEEDFFGQLEDAQTKSAPAPRKSTGTPRANTAKANENMRTFAAEPRSAPAATATATASNRMQNAGRAQTAPVGAALPGSRADAFGEGALPPQTVLSRVIAELEDDYAHYRAIYGELAEQYKILDAAGATNKRGILAKHLKEVIDTLEQKAEQIRALYSLLSFQDRPDDRAGNGGGVPRSSKEGGKTPTDVLRMVRETLGDEALERLEEDGMRMGLGKRRLHRLV